MCVGVGVGAGVGGLVAVILCVYGSPHERLDAVACLVNVYV